MKRSAGITTAKPVLSIFLFVLAACAPVSGPAEETFPFPFSGFDRAATATDVSALNQVPLGGPVRIVNGHFADSQGQRLRLLGVNFSFGANFPEHADAEKVAAHLAKFGVNAVRHHHMDARDIWRSNPDGSRDVDPAKLEKLAFLITQLAKNGVYSNLNLHVSRSVTAAEGFANASDLPRYNKYVLYFDERLKGLLKDYARTLLTYRNPHTGRRLADEPSLVTVEITNENRLALNGHEQLFSLPQKYQDEFTRRWNVYLKEKYVTTARLKAAWDGDSEPLGEDIADFSEFGKNANSWGLSVRGGNQAKLRLDQAGPQGKTRAVQIAIDRNDGAIHQLEFGRGGLSVESGKLYTLSFWIRSAKPRSVFFDVSQNGGDWQPVGIRESLETSDSWQHVVRPFRATKSLQAGARWIFKLGDDDADVYLAAPRLQKGGEAVPLIPGRSLESGTVPVPRFSIQEAVAADLKAFMEDMEKTFFEEMVRYLKDDIGVKAPITGSQVRWQSLSAFEPLDFVDAHAYWQHPQFPRQSWSSSDWTILNTAMVANPGSDALSRLAWYRVWGRPYTVSEYNHPAPNDYQIECIPLLCAIAALQDWDGVYVYSYQHGSENWDGDRIQGFFDINGNPAKLALLPTGAMIFRRQDLKPAQTRVTAGQESDPTRGMALQHLVGADLRAESALNNLSIGEERTFASDTGELRWDGSDPEHATFSVDTPMTKLLLGFIAPGEASLKGLKLKMGSTSTGFGLVALTSLDGTPLSTSRHMLLTTIANASNKGMQWNDSRTSVADRWGTAPPMVEIVPAAVTVERDPSEEPGKWKAFPLDPTGQRSRPVPITVHQRSLRLQVDAAAKAVWYELVFER